MADRPRRPHIGHRHVAVLCLGDVAIVRELFRLAGARMGPARHRRGWDRLVGGHRDDGTPTPAGAGGSRVLGWRRLDASAHGGVVIRVRVYRLGPRPCSVVWHSLGPLPLTPLKRPTSSTASVAGASPQTASESTVTATRRAMDDHAGCQGDGGSKLGGARLRDPATGHRRLG